jgi:hypothetical protein
VAYSERVEVRKQSGGEFGSRGSGPSESRFTRGEFPPGPGDVRWADIVAEFPDLAPAVESQIRRVVDGSASRVDRLRTLGNSVVPTQAEFAFRLLWNVITRCISCRYGDSEVMLV